jgi:hypothetical protein
VLIGVEDVAAGLGEEAADGGDQPGLIGAGEKQARGGRLAGDAGMIPVEATDRSDRWVARTIACIPKVLPPFVPELVLMRTRMCGL